MPITPSHLGTGLFLGALGPRFFNLWALLLGSVAMDGENVFWTVINILRSCPRCTHHGFFHSFLGAMVGSLILSLILLWLKNPLERISRYLDLEQPFAFKALFVSSFLGWSFHILLDSLVHRDVFPFWPLKTNPFLFSWTWYWPLSYFLAGLGALSLTFLVIRNMKIKND